MGFYDANKVKTYSFCDRNLLVGYSLPIVQIFFNILDYTCKRQMRIETSMFISAWYVDGCIGMELYEIYLKEPFREYHILPLPW